MRHYETMFIIRPTLNADEIKERISFYENAIIKNGGEIAARLDMGMRNLTYEIKKQKRGYYFVIYFKAPSALVLELERLYRINEDILRHIIIKYAKVNEQKTWQSLVDKASKKPATKIEKATETETTQAPAELTEVAEQPNV